MYFALGLSLYSRKLLYIASSKNERKSFVVHFCDFLTMCNCSQLHVSFLLTPPCNKETSDYLVMTYRV